MWIVVKQNPETVAFVHGCDEQAISMSLFYHTDLVCPHEVVKAVLRLRRDWCHFDGVHDNWSRFKTEVPVL